MNGSLDSVKARYYFALMDEELDIGDVSVSSDELLHPDTACRSTRSGSSPCVDEHSPITAWILDSCNRSNPVISLL